ncbi:MAG: ATP-grasp domain-containing protein [Parachlamydiales bacterium]|nr:ATP-grasp domain-containing protein [Parachlamydiales bacterium]
MRYCFILAVSRFSYYNIEKILRDLPEKINFVLIVDEEHQKNVPDSFKTHLSNIFVIEKIDFEICKQIIKSQRKKGNYNPKDSIVCADEKSLITAAQLREYFNLSGPKPYEYVPFSSKRIMKQILSIANVKVPKFVDFEGILTKNELSKYHFSLYDLFKGPYVVKPLDGGGSEDTAIIKNFENLQKWYDKSFSYKNNYTAEQYIEGTFYLCDSFVYNKQIKFTEISEYLCPNLNFTFGFPIGAIPLRKNTQLRERALNLNKEVVKALNPPNGGLHLEFFVEKQSNELIFLEIGARPPGKNICFMHEKNFDVNLYELTLRCELGLPLNINLKENLYHSLIHLACYPGIVNKLNPPKLKSHTEIAWHIKINDNISRYPLSLKEGVAADILLQNTNYDELLEDFYMLKTHKPYL